MTIVCGTDFTPAAADATRVAAGIARTLGQKLLLVHVFEPAVTEDQLVGHRGQAADPLRRFVDEEAGRLRDRLRVEAERLSQNGAPVETELLGGTIDEAIVRRAGAQAALVVIGALGRRSPSMWALGSHADRIAQTSQVPVLVVRNPAPLLAWLERRQRLRILAAVDGSPTSEAALKWLARFAELAPCEVIAAHVYWPPDEIGRLAASKRPRSLSIGRSDPELEEVLRGELEPRLAVLANQGAIKLKLAGGLGRVADHLVQVAGEEKADLAVVGSHQRSGFNRFWTGSVSRGVIDLAPCSVACVPWRAEHD